MKKICLTLITFTFLFIQFGLVQETWAASPTVITKNTTVQTHNNNNCQLHFVWMPYDNHRTLSYGAWDGSYTVFLFPEGQTRDQYVAKETTRNTSVTFNNLVKGQDYDAEIFITGAFIAGPSPYWKKLDSINCKYETVGQVTNPTNVYRVASAQEPVIENTTVEVLPDTGLELWYFILIPTVLLILGAGLSVFTKKILLRKS